VPYAHQTAWSLAADLPQRLGALKGSVALPAVPYLLAHMRRRQQYLAACDAVVAVSGYIAQRLHGIVPPDKIHVIPNMVDLVATDALLAQPSTLVPAAPFLLFVGKLERNKGAQLLPALIAAAQRDLPQGHPALQHLVVAGDGPLRPLLARELAALGVRATFLDWAVHDEVLRLMARCTLLLFPSYWGEPLSRVLLEACATGASVAAMPTGGTPDIIVDGVHGVPAPTPEALGRRAATLLADEPQRRALGAAARRRAEQRFAATVVLKQFEALYTDLLTKNE
jgi:glycogen synthase